jgi:hypothetical protein
MGLLTMPFKLPLRPVQGVMRLGQVLEEEAERQLRDPARIRRELDSAQRRYEAGEITEEEFIQIQDKLASTLVTEVAPPPVPGAAGDDGS